MQVQEVCLPAPAAAGALSIEASEHALSTPDAAKHTALPSPCLGLETPSPCLQPIGSISAPTSAVVSPETARLAQSITPLQSSAAANVELPRPHAEKQQQSAQEVTNHKATVSPNAGSNGVFQSLRTMADSKVTALLEQQLRKVDLTDAAYLLVLAVATAAAAMPAERARAGLFPWPYYFIGTRDSFTHELVPIQSQVSNGVLIKSCTGKCFLSFARDIFVGHVQKLLCTHLQDYNLNANTSLLTCDIYHCKVDLDARQP